MFFLFGAAGEPATARERISAFIASLAADDRWRYDGWEISRTQMHVLDLTVYKGLRMTSNKLTYRTHFKKTSLGIPLSVTSGHPHSIHESWMRAELGRISRTSSGLYQFKLGKQILIDR